MTAAGVELLSSASRLRAIGPPSPVPSTTRKYRVARTVPASSGRRAGAVTEWGRLRLHVLLLLLARRRSTVAGTRSRTHIDRWSPGGSEDSHRDPRRWLRGGLHGTPPGKALQAAAGCRDRSGEPGQLPPGHAAALRSVLGHPRPAALRVPRTGVLANHPLRRGHCPEHRPGAPHGTRGRRGSKSHADL